ATCASPRTATTRSRTSTRCSHRCGDTASCSSSRSPPSRHTPARRSAEPSSPSHSATVCCGGFILFGVSLGKIFLFDLPSLSSAQRALSFLAVGAVLLLGGFFYQRLSAQYDERIA